MGLLPYTDFDKNRGSFHWKGAEAGNRAFFRHCSVHFPNAGTPSGGTVAKALMTTDHKRAAKLAHLLQSYFLFGQFCCDGEEAMEAVREVYL